MNQDTCIVFDIDGVLIDTRKSYNESIKQTVQYLVKHVNPNIGNVESVVTDDMIFNFRKSGMFNNDTDTTYAFILSIVCGPPKISDLNIFLEKITANATTNGIKSVEKFVLDYSNDKDKTIETMRILNYPGAIQSSIVARVFDEYFYGPYLFKKQHNSEPRYYFGSPLIENDVLLVNDLTIKRISDHFDKRVGIVSGRSKVAANYSLKRLYEYFDTDASIFLEDEKREMAKPNPFALIKSITKMGVSNAFYVGDSAEDMFMVFKAREESPLDVQLIGICPSNSRANQIRKLFKENGTSLIAHDVNELPNILNKVKTQF
jgi:phosphoglycolate phosphatase-like HAD superfamily hydrolase